MPKKAKVKNWTEKEVANLKKYIKENSQQLKSQLLMNILMVSMHFSKQKGFYKTLSSIVGRTLPKCKSKFQKMEKDLYLKTLKISELDYEVFQWIRFESQKEIEQQRKLKKMIQKKTRSRNLRKTKNTILEKKSLQIKKIKKKPKYTQKKIKELTRRRTRLIKKYLKNDLNFNGISRGLL